MRLCQSLASDLSSERSYTGCSVRELSRGFWPHWGYRELGVCGCAYTAVGQTSRLERGISGYWPIEWLTTKPQGELEKRLLLNPLLANLYAGCGTKFRPNTPRG
jgi:hypothetical protein